MRRVFGDVCVDTGIFCTRWSLWIGETILDLKLWNVVGCGEEDAEVRNGEWERRKSGWKKEAGRGEKACAYGVSVGTSASASASASLCSC